MPKSKIKLTKFDSSAEAQPSFENAGRQQEEYKKMLEEKYLLEKNGFAQKLVNSFPLAKLKKGTELVNADDIIDRMELIINDIQRGKGGQEAKDELKGLIGRLVKSNVMIEAEANILKNKFAL